MTKTALHKLSRHTEYYSLENDFDKLFYLSQNGFNNFTNLYDLAFSKKNICLAFRNIKNNKGSMTPGLDGLSIKQLKAMPLETIINSIQNMAKQYNPSIVKRVWIPKANGKLRPIGIPSLIDRLFQQCVKQVIEPICEAKFNPYSFGFRPNRSGKHALARAYSLINLNQLHFVVDVDIKSFFDTINHKKLIRQCWTLGIRDKRLLCILSKMLKAEIQGEGIPSKGTPQGGILSPLLSNICLNELDWWLSSQWETFPSKRLYSKNSHKYRALRSNSKLKEFCFVRYADDFKIFCRDYETARKIFIATKRWLSDRLSLQISVEKSSITNLRKKSSPFLGLLLHCRPGKNNKLVCRSRVKPEAIKAMQLQIKSLIYKLQKNPNISNIKLYNYTIIGFQNYYNSATDCTTDFNKLGYILFKSLRTRLKGVISLNGIISSTYQKRYKRKSKPIFIKEMALFPIADIQHKKLYQFKQEITPYTIKGRKYMHSELNSLLKSNISSVSSSFDPKQSMEFNDNRISKWSAQKGRCAITGTYVGSDFDCHHIIPRSKGGTDVFKNLVVVSRTSHLLIHAVAPWTIQTLLSGLKISLSCSTRKWNNILKKLNKFRDLAGNKCINKV